METTIGIILYRACIGITEKKIETTISGYMGIIWDYMIPLSPLIISSVDPGMSSCA